MVEAARGARYQQPARSPAGAARVIWGGQAVHPMPNGRRAAWFIARRPFATAGGTPHLCCMDETLTNLGLMDEEDIVLDAAALSLAQLDHDDVDPTPHLELIEAIATRLDTVAADATDGVDQAAALSQVIAEEFGFTGDDRTYDDPANADLIRVIERRRGLPVSLAILYVAAARRIGWTAEVLDVPGHVMILIGDAAPVIVDPFRNGIVVGPDQLSAMLKANADGSAPVVSHVAAMPNRAILVRLLLNQSIRAEQAGDVRRALTLYERMTALAPEFSHGWWERARLELADLDVAAARSSLTAMLETTRDPNLRRRVTEVLASLPAH
jgi:regulator of sirC expression with transglutaminase-like and TPR domain